MIPSGRPWLLFIAAAGWVLYLVRSEIGWVPSELGFAALQSPLGPEVPVVRIDAAGAGLAQHEAAFAAIKEAKAPPAEDLLNGPFAQLSPQLVEGNGRTLIIVAFERSPRSRENIEFLLQQVVGGPRAHEMDFIFVDTSKEGPFHCFPDLPNVRYIHRPRVGLDICSYKTGLAIVPSGLYTYVVLMNGSVRGPFSRAHDFLRPFKEQLNARTPVVGTSVNCGPRLHLQSMFFMLNSVGTDLMNATLSCDVPHHGAAMNGPHGEVNMSTNVLQAGYNLGATQLIWRGRDLRNNSVLRKTCHYVGRDPYAPGRDRDPVTLEVKDIDPEDVIFFKTTRLVGKERVKNLTRDFQEECQKDRSQCGLVNLSLAASACR